MIKKAILFVLFVVLAHQNFAQTSYGIKGGFNWVRLNVNSEDPYYEKWGYPYKPAFHVGLYSKYNMSERFSVNPELLFSNKGYISNNTSEGAKVYSHLNYLNLPVMAGLKLFKRMDLLFGPEFGYLLNRGAKYNKEQYNRFDAGYALGANLHAGEKVYISFRYSYGLTSVINPDKSQPPATEKVSFQNQSYQFSIGYRLK
ncbi:porin family protein [Pontibacter beigongshangensis]|uniref:porin family protein n=1 Tax=Pontibacter beigongshangensis TaxID=2574733 RepID=UPI00164FC526|nr:porin family protein [Pontibacter beigongshangensis]